MPFFSGSLEHLYLSAMAKLVVNYNEHQIKTRVTIKMLKICTPFSCSINTISRSRAYICDHFNVKRISTLTTLYKSHISTPMIIKT